MKIFPSALIREIDKATCEKRQISSLDLMESAAAAVCREITSRIKPSQRIIVFAGPGNNGGDALAVARMLFEEGYRKIEVILLNVLQKLSHDCDEERKKLLEFEGIKFQEVTDDFFPPVLGKDDVVIDGLFGSGLSSKLEGGFASIARHISESGAFVISIDIPSGMFGEWNDNVSHRDMVHADLTLSFELPRLSFFFEENAELLGDCHLLDIGLDAEKIKELPSDFFLVEEKSVRPLLPPRNKFSQKRDFGSVIIFAGSTGMGGAAILAAKGCLRSGVGIVTVHSCAALLTAVQSALWEAIFEPDRCENFISDMTLHHPHKAVVVGPGIGVNEKTADAIESLLKNYKKPMVLDADALNCIAKRPHLLTLIPQCSILTPHAREFDRLFGEHRNSEERLRKAISVAKEYNIIIVLKSHFTAVVRPTGRVYFNSTGNAGMATPGSGDVLAGVIGAFLAQGFRPERAASLGVYIHGLAGDLAVEETGEYGLLASDIADYCGKAIKTLSMPQRQPSSSIGEL